MHFNQSTVYFHGSSDSLILAFVAVGGFLLTIKSRALRTDLHSAVFLRPDSTTAKIVARNYACEIGMVAHG